MSKADSADRTSNALESVPRGRGPVSREPKPDRDRRLEILLAAEKLFAINGYHAVSIRDIAAEAGVPLRLVGYYFGAKHELYYAIFESWRPVINGRLEALRTVTLTPRREDSIERIVQAFVGPLFESPDGQYFARMGARDAASPTPESEKAVRDFFDPLANAFIDALMAACPGTTRAQVAWCYQYALGAMLYFMLSGPRVERLSKGETKDGDPHAKAALLRFLSAGLREALVPAATPAPQRTKKRT